MTEGQVRARVRMFGAVDTEPALDPAEVSTLIEMSKRIDRYGLYPTDTGWTPTYDVNWVIAHVWLVKAGRLADRYLFMSGGKMFSRNQFHEHCMDLYHKFMMKSPIRSQRLGPQSERVGVVPNNWNPG